MRHDPVHLETLLTITEEGSFDAAARRLHVTPSAVSQRVRALERSAGQVLVRRTTPPTVTDAGVPLVRLARQLRLLLDESSVSDDMASHGVVDLPVAINADSLATWARPVLASVADLPHVALRIHVEDETRSHELLRRGDVLAAVTAEPRPLSGCTSQPLGALRYRAVVAPALASRHTAADVVDLSTLPVVTFDERDRLQDVVLDARGTPRPRVVHRVPSTADFRAAVLAGLGWGLLPDSQARPDLAAGRLVALPGVEPIDVALHWQRWRLDSPAIGELSSMVRAAAADGLVPRGG